jgi:CRISPR/Cas system-associated exonuclease Cas4 (RecB family)
MEYFLEKIARSLYVEFGNTLDRHCVVFPSRRAGLYFLKYLSSGISKPVWAPSVLTINELISSYSSLQIPGSEILLFELYKVYRRLIRQPENFDSFYFWGDMVLNDFDDTDKYLADASLLFANIRDIKNIDRQFGGLTEEQVEIIRRFWTNVNPENLTDVKSGFLNLWAVLYDLYSGFRASLREQNLAYEGMLFREMAEAEDLDAIIGKRWDIIHFIGFNALNECEKVIMKKLKLAGRARFYWDFDNSYIDEENLNSAGFFLRDNLKLLGNDMPGDWEYDTFISKENSGISCRIIETSSDIAQVKLIPEIISGLAGITNENAHHTAVIIADENLLIPVTTSLPGNTGDINITMGYPLKQTVVYDLVKHLLDLQKNAVVRDKFVYFSYRDVMTILKHSLISGLQGSSDKDLITEITKSNLVWIPSEFFSSSVEFSRLFQKLTDPVSLSSYLKDILTRIAHYNLQKSAGSESAVLQVRIINEFIFRVLLAINRISGIAGDPDLPMTAETYMRILDRVLRMQSVPFSGEPLSGIQIMGILETRALDFNNLVILSVNEGILPAVPSGSSFIPLNLRQAFGLPSVNHQESIYAYHFYRLLHRAENVTLIYNSNSEGLRSGEMSRFLLQMKYDSVIKADFVNLKPEIRTHGRIGERIERTEEHNRQLISLFAGTGSRRLLSPSAINTWLHCRMKFYYRYVNLLKEPEKITPSIEPAMLGNILHEIMRNLYQRFKGMILSKEILDSIINNREYLSGVTDEAISHEFSRTDESITGGNELIVKEVLIVYILKILNSDRDLAPLKILNLEDYFTFRMPLFPDGSDIQILTGGIIDRIDEVDGTVRIVDYKTGNVTDRIKSVGELFKDDRENDIDGWLQTLVYCEAYHNAKPGGALRPSVYKIKRLSGESVTDKLIIRSGRDDDLIVDDYDIIRDVFVNNLKNTVSRIFNSDEPFYMTGSPGRKCVYCPYRSLCMR